MYQADKYNANRPNSGVTVVPFIFEDNTIKTLIYKRAQDAEVFAGMYCLPNAIFDINKFDTLEETAAFALMEKTSVKLNHIEQVYTFSGKYIDPRITTENTTYLSICSSTDITEVGESKFEKIWMPVDKVLKKELAFNHNEALLIAYQRLKAKAEYTPLSAHLLGNSFTISDFKNVIDILMDITLDNSRFRDRIKKSDVLIALENEFKTGSNRPAQLYELNKDYKDYFYPRSMTKSK